MVPRWVGLRMDGMPSASMPGGSSAKCCPCWPGPPTGFQRGSHLPSSPGKMPAPLISKQQPLPIHHSHCLISCTQEPLPPRPPALG